MKTLFAIVIRSKHRRILATVLRSLREKIDIPIVSENHIPATLLKIYVIGHLVHVHRVRKVHVPSDTKYYISLNLKKVVYRLHCGCNKCEE